MDNYKRIKLRPPKDFFSIMIEQSRDFYIKTEVNRNDITQIRNKKLKKIIDNI